MTQGLRVGRAETKNRSGRCSEIERREAIARERADQQVVCSVRWGRLWRGRLWQASPMAFAVPSALMVPATNSVRFIGGRLQSQGRKVRSIRAVGKK